METTQATAYQASSSTQSATAAEMSVKDWVITLFIMFIPLVNIIMLFVWAFGGDGRTPTKANWAKASLIWMAVAVALYIFIMIAFGAALLSAAGNM